MRGKAKNAWNGMKTSEIENWIEENCHSRRDREILKMRMLDKLIFPEISDVVGLSQRQVKTIVYKYNDLIEQSA